MAEATPAAPTKNGGGGSADEEWRRDLAWHGRGGKRSADEAGPRVGGTTSVDDVREPGEIVVR